MASVTARLSVFGENGYNEPDQDANSALTELDKGLRSGKVGDQSEAIVRFPRLFEKYPFPILINSALLKLAEVFRLGSNFLKLCVLKVTQQSEKHLDKILNVDEFVRRIFSVVHSNDPVARALTLRTLGSIATIIQDRKNVHHSIRLSLDSHDAIELDAAIYAAGRFASCSKIFASNIFGKIGEMIEGLKTPVEVKLKLVPIFQHMHHDAETASTVRKVCTDLLPRYSAHKFVTVTLDTLTQLAASSQIDISAQVSLLIQYLDMDARNSVKVNVLQNLAFLAAKGAHLWNSDQMRDITGFTANTPYKDLKRLSLVVLTSLAKSVAVSKLDIESGSVFLDMCLEACYHNDSQVAAQAVQLLTQIARHTFQEDCMHDDMDLFEDAVMAIESLLLAITAPGEENPVQIQVLKTCLKCTVNLCEVNAEVAPQFANSIGTLLARTSGQTAALLCEALAAIASRKMTVLNILVADLISTLHRVSDKQDLSGYEGHHLVMLCTLLLPASHTWPDPCEIRSHVMKALEKADLWVCYKVGRQAARYGCHSVASQIFERLAIKASSEHMYFWLTSLGVICAGESGLSDSKLSACVDKIMMAVSHYMRGISALKAATTPNHSLLFQCEYIRLRSEMLQAHGQLVRACTSHRTAPPPAIAASVANATRDELHKCGRIVGQLRKSVKEFRNLGDQYIKLYQSTFDADPNTLTNIQVLQQSCFLMAYAIENIALKSQGIGFVGSDENGSFDTSMGLCKLNSPTTLDVQGVMNASRDTTAIILQIAHQSDLKPVSHQHIDAILQVSKKLTEIPLCLPRYFFQALQSTVIKLAISPQPRAPGEPINVQNNSHLALKVEGVIQNSARPGLFRKVNKVVLNVSSQLQARSHSSNIDTKMTNDGSNSMTQTVEPHNEYFNAHFLLTFPSAGLHVITIEASVLDEKQDLWKTGPKSILSAKSYDDSGSQKQGHGSSYQSTSRY